MKSTLPTASYRRLAGLLGTLILVSVPGLGLGGEPSVTVALPQNHALVRTGSCAGCGAVCCLDDYTRKPAPCVFPVPNCCPDTYCPKPALAWPCPVLSCCCNDYCAKPLPALCRPSTQRWYQCIPAAHCYWLRCGFLGDKSD